MLQAEWEQFVDWWFPRRSLCWIGMAIACAPCAAFGQNSGYDELLTDRDSFTPSVLVSGRGWTIVESSFSFIDNHRVPETYSLPELLVRHGISERWELRLGWNYVMGGPGTPVANVDFGDEDFVTASMSRLLYGVKFQQTRQRGWLPNSCLIVEGYTPTSGTTNISTVAAGEVFGWTFGNGWEWNSAMFFGTDQQNEDSFTQWAPSTVLKIPVTERWNLHAEYFGIMSYRKEEPTSLHYASVGGHYNWTKNFETGLRVGFGLNDQTPKFFSNVGFGWRF